MGHKDVNLDAANRGFLPARSNSNLSIHSARTGEQQETGKTCHVDASYAGSGPNDIARQKLAFKQKRFR